MAQATRPSEDYVAQARILSADFNADFNTIYDAYNAHDSATGSVHGIGASEGALVGTTKTQTLSNKTMKNGAQVLSGFTGATVKGKVYKCDGAALTLAAKTDTNLREYLLGVGTGNTGEVQVFGIMTGLSAFPTAAPKQLYLGAAGAMLDVTKSGSEFDSGDWQAFIAMQLSSTSVFININQPNITQW